MKEIISEVIDIDKEMRNKITKIQKEKEKIPKFLHDEKERISKEKTQEAKDLIESKKQEIEADLKMRISKANTEYEGSKQYIDEKFKKQREEWIEEIYKYCISK